MTSSCTTFPSAEYSGGSNNIYVVSRRLQRKGYEVLIARDGAEGLAQAKSRAPALILVDLGLPVIDGWEVTRQLRVAPETAAVPIIALSAHAMPEDRERALAAGCNDFIAKPVDFPCLINRIEVLLRTKSKT